VIGFTERSGLGWYAPNEPGAELEPLDGV